MGTAQTMRGAADPLGRLIGSGWFEPVLAGLLAVLVVLLQSYRAGAWQPMALDLAACAAAAATARWPRAAGVALAGILSVYLVIPQEWATMGEYAPLIPILATGMKGAATARNLMTIGYGLLLGALMWQSAPTATEAILGCLVWLALIGVLWLIGNAFRAGTIAHEQQRAAELVLQRQAVARELHDTVARSLTMVAMSVEQARLRGAASEADLAAIGAAADASQRDLRLVMKLLRNPDEAGGDLAVRPTPLATALAAGRSVLDEHGFAVAISIDGDLGALPPRHSEVLGAAVAEAINNIVKHGDPTRPCAIVADVAGDPAEIVLLNQPRPGHAPPPDGTSLGLWTMQERLAVLGGTVSSAPGPAQWQTTIQLPLHSAERSRARLA